jgi:hypothetical protein
LFAACLILFASCKKETPAPTATFTASVTSNVVIFTAVVTDVDKFEWNFGDASVVSTIQNPTHTYAEYGRDYTVTLKVTGGGGQLTVTKTVTIPAMTKMEMLTGGTSDTNGKKWRISSATEVTLAYPTADLTVDKIVPAGVLTALGMGQVYTDEYIFFSDGDYTISPKGGGVLAGLIYCMVNSIANTPTVDGAAAGLTYATPYTPPTGLTFALNLSKNLTVTTTADGINAVNVTYNNVMTLSFSTGGFIGLKDFMSECIVQELTEATLKIAFFASVVPPAAPQVGKSTNVLIFTFEVAP